MTMTKSSQHQALVKYLTKPRANHLTDISMAKMTVKILSMQQRTSCRTGRSARQMSSAACTHKQTNKQLLQSTLLYTFTILSPKRWNERVVVDYADMRILTRTSFVSLLLVNFKFFLVTLSLQQAGVYCKEGWIRLKELSESFYLIFNNLFRILNHKTIPKVDQISSSEMEAGVDPTILFTNVQSISPTACLTLFFCN